MKNLSKSFLILLLLTSFTQLNAQTKAESADNIINRAKVQAAKENKNVFIIFHASWCVWCHKMDTAMNETALKPLFNKNYVIEHITVDEAKDKKDLENPGGNAVRTKYGGDNQGIPYWFIINKKGELLADSRMTEASGKPGSNVGCPAQPDEVAFFIQALKKTSKLSEKELNIIKERFLKTKS